MNNSSINLENIYNENIDSYNDNKNQNVDESNLNHSFISYEENNNEKDFSVYSESFLADSDEDEQGTDYESDFIKNRNEDEVDTDHEESFNSHIVASIGHKPYDSLDSAIAEAKNGDTVVIENDITLDHEIKINKSLTILANGKRTIKRAANFKGCLFTFMGQFSNIGDNNIKNCLTLDGGQIEGCKSLVYCETPIYATGNFLTIKNTKLCNNIAQGEGGAIHIAPESTLCIEQTEIFNNTARHGGAIYGNINTKIYLDANVKIHDNKAINSGGAVQFAGENLTLSYTEIFNNNALYGGAIVCFNKAKLATELNIKNNVKMHDNKATKDGGAVLFYEGNLKVSGQNTEIYNNSAVNGGAFYCYSKTNLDINGDVKVYNNTAIDIGGAVFLNQGDINLSGQTEIYKNSATNCGAICLKNTANFTIKDTVKIHDNMADNYAGAILGYNPVNINN